MRKRIIKDIDSDSYFEEWWSRQLIYTKTNEHKKLAKYRWDKIREWLKLNSDIKK